jgi:hypothetical protein
MLEVAYGKEGVTFETETDENGTVLVDEHGGAVVKMLPFFLNKNEDGAFVDYNGNLVPCAATEAENGYTKIEQYYPDSTDVKATYYVKDDGNGNYFAREEANDEAAEVLFHKVTIGDMSTDSKQIIDNIYLKDALSLYAGATEEEDPHGVLMSLAYGKKDINYEIADDGNGRYLKMLNGSTYRTIGDLRKRGTDLINDIGLADIMKENRDDAITMYLLYGKENVHYEIDPVTGEINMKKQRIAVINEDQVYNEYGEQLQKKDPTQKGYEIVINGYVPVSYTDVDGVEYLLVDSGETMEVQHGTATLYYLYKDGRETYYEKSTLGDLTGSVNLVSTLTDRMTVGEIFGEDANNNFFLKHLKGSTISGLPEAISDLTVGQVFETEIAEKPNTWKYLLKDTVSADNGKNYKVAGELNNLLTNMTTNISTASLSELSNDGVITLDSAALNSLTTPLKSSIAGNDIDTFGKTTLGELTSSELLSYISAILTIVN